MLKLSQNAIGMLLSKYSAVLKRMFLKNSAALAASVLIFSAAPAQAADFAVGTNQAYANLAALAAAVDAGTAVFRDGDTITIHTPLLPQAPPLISAAKTSLSNQQVAPFLS